jgi:DNA modification methylase
MPEADYQDWQRRFLELLHGIVRDGASVFYNHKIRHSKLEAISPMLWLPGPFKFRQEIIWKRPGSVAQNARMFIPCTERIYWLYKGDNFTFNNRPETKGLSDVWEIAPVKNTHPAPFPPELPRRCIEACSRRGDVVYDPFAGSGSTIIAAEIMNRNCLAMEIDPSFCDQAIIRWQRETKQAAVLEGTKKTYAQVSRESLRSKRSKGGNED